LNPERTRTANINEYQLITKSTTNFYEFIESKNPSKSETLKDFKFLVTPMIQNSNHLLEDLKLLSEVFPA